MISSTFRVKTKLLKPMKFPFYNFLNLYFLYLGNRQLSWTKENFSLIFLRNINIITDTFIVKYTVAHISIRNCDTRDIIGGYTCL